MEIYAQGGVLEWIGIRTKRRGTVIPLTETFLDGNGLEGDHYESASGKGKRAVTLMQAEHIPVVSSLLGRFDLEPRAFRRNLVIGGINLLALKTKVFDIGEVRFKGTGICAPCSRMESALGKGGFNAMRGHGGITANIIEPGFVRLGDQVSAVRI